MDKILQFNKWSSIVSCHKSLFIWLYSSLAEILAWMPTNCWSLNTWACLRSQSYCPCWTWVLFYFSVCAGVCWHHWVTASPYDASVNINKRSLLWTVKLEKGVPLGATSLTSSRMGTGFQLPCAFLAWCLCAVYKLHKLIWQFRETSLLFQAEVGWLSAREAMEGVSHRTSGRYLESLPKDLQT